MTFLHSILLGLVQGFTEFLPVSSSAHLWLTETFLLKQPASLPLEAFLHVSTLLAVLVFFRKKIWRLLIGFFVGKKEDADRIFALKLLAATVITAAIGLGLKPFLEVGVTQYLVATTLTVTGLFIVMSDRAKVQKSAVFSWKIALFLGLVQGVAVLPGISRSGATIAFLLLMGLERKQSVEISFLLAIPAIAGAGILLIPELQFSAQTIPPLLAGGIAAFLSGLLAIWTLLKWVQSGWKYFAFWCFGVALLLFTFRLFPTDSAVL